MNYPYYLNYNSLNLDLINFIKLAPLPHHMHIESWETEQVNHGDQPFQAGRVVKREVPSIRHGDRKRLHFQRLDGLPGFPGAEKFTGHTNRIEEQKKVVPQVTQVWLQALELVEREAD